MSSALTAGCISAILRGDAADNCVVQVLGHRKMTQDKGDRYRLKISDGKDVLSHTLLGTQLNGMITSGEIENNTVIKVHKSFSTPSVKKVFVLLDVTVVMSAAQAGGIIGNPASDVTRPTPTNSHFAAPGTPVRNSTPKPAMESPGRNVHPIQSLNPYQNRWTIRARVTNKSDIRTWNNSKGEGKLFSIDMLDDSGEIRATGFNEQCDQFFDMLEVNKVYYITKATIKNANKRFTSIKNDYELTFNSGTEIIPCNDVPDDLPVVQFDFVAVNNLEKLSADSIVDVIGICRSFSDIQTIVARTTGKEMKKRDIQLVDSSNTEVALTLWGETAAKFDGSRNPVIAIKGAKLSDFNGRSVSVLYSSVLHIDPDIKEAHALRGWFDSEGANSKIVSISSKAGGSGFNVNWKEFWDADNEQLGHGEKPDYFTVMGEITFVKHENALYKACPGTDCNKKVIDMNNGMYRCEKCNQEYGSFKWRILLQVQIIDTTLSKWATLFQESAEVVVGMTADELGQLKENSERNQTSEYVSHMNKICFKQYIFKCRIKMETYNNESRLKTVVVNVAPINYADYAKQLIEDIKKLPA